MPTEKQIDELAYKFWSVHPTELDEWVKTAPPMPDRYRGGVRAWFFACHMRSLTAAEAQEVKPRVKPLEWDRGVVDWARPLPGMKYVACSSDPHPHWSWWLDGLEGPIDHHKCANEQAAKAAAQADYEARILGALE
jgi:hypothetical protein